MHSFPAFEFQQVVLKYIWQLHRTLRKCLRQLVVSRSFVGVPGGRICRDSIPNFAFRWMQLKNSQRRRLGNEMQISGPPGVLLTPSRINSKIGGVIRGGGNVSIDRQTVSTEVMTRRQAGRAAPPGRGHVLSLVLSLARALPPPPPGRFYSKQTRGTWTSTGGWRWEEGGGGRSNIDPLPPPPPPPERDSALFSCTRAAAEISPPPARKGGKQKRGAFGATDAGSTQTSACMYVCVCERTMGLRRDGLDQTHPEGCCMSWPALGLGLVFNFAARMMC